MAEIPQTPGFDNTLTLMRAPYDFIAERCHRHQTDLFQTRLLLRKTICMKGQEAAKLFYDPNRFVRQGAAPEPLRATLFGKGGIQGTDGETHRKRKAMFMSFMTRESIARLAEFSGQWWQTYAGRWVASDRVALYDEAQEILTRAVCAWAGLPLSEAEVPERRRELAALFDEAGAKGPGHLWARLARKKAEHWVAGLVARYRADYSVLAQGSPAQVIATHREPDGTRLRPRLAAVEIINLLRPTVAVSVYIVLIAHALHQNPPCRRKLLAGEEGYDDCFVQEVRRFYPFFPAVLARVRDHFEWEGYQFPKGRRVMLDLYGTNHDDKSWDAPHEFRPERFRQWNESPYNFIPQGGGDHYAGHRCPGEWITIELMKVALHFLTRCLCYEVPEQDLQIDRSRLPALPKSRFIISKARLI